MTTTDFASATSEFKSLSTLMPGAHLMLNGHVSLVDEIVRSDGSKVHVKGKDVFSEKRVEELFHNSQQIVECPILKERTFQLADISVDEMSSIWYRVTLLNEYGKEMEPLLVSRNEEAIVFSQGLYGQGEMKKAREMKIAFDREANRPVEATRTIAVDVIEVMNKMAFKNFSLREEIKRPLPR